MAFDEEDEERIQAIESKLNEIQLALNSLATKSQLNQLLTIISRRLDDLDAEIVGAMSTVVIAGVSGDIQGNLLGNVQGTVSGVLDPATTGFTWSA